MLRQKNTLIQKVPKQETSSFKSPTFKEVVVFGSSTTKSGDVSRIVLLMKCGVRFALRAHLIDWRTSLQTPKPAQQLQKTLL
mmetsp:Transcript_17875/g.40376  ORF Transcript_17875/g.40376 Transcript_17875/m.40376 type:complete len:82 (-) Transcript_17875:12-257(-)